LSESRSTTSAECPRVGFQPGILETPARGVGTSGGGESIKARNYATRADGWQVRPRWMAGARIHRPRPARRYDPHAFRDSDEFTQMKPIW